MLHRYGDYKNTHEHIRESADGGYRNTHEKISESHHIGNAWVCCTTTEPRLSLLNTSRKSLISGYRLSRKEIVRNLENEDSWK